MTSVVETAPNAQDYLEAFAFKEVVFAQVEVFLEGGEWTPVDGVGFQGTVNRTFYFSEIFKTWGIQVSPAEEIPKGQQFASRAPWHISSEPFWSAPNNSPEELYRIVLTRIG